MPRERIDLEPFRQQITDLWLRGLTGSDLCNAIQTELIIRVSQSTLKRTLRLWGLRRLGRTADDGHLRERLRFHFFERYQTDASLHAILQSEGFEITLNGLTRLRKEMGLRKRHAPAENIVLREQIINHLATTEDPTRRMEGFGREYLRTELRQEGISASRDVIYSAYKALYPRAFRDRLDEFQRRRTGWNCPGPNHTWSIDAYDKLQPYGFEIYAGIDAYSRFIPWFTVSFSTHTSIGVGLQYLSVIRTLGFAPRIIRADRGKETPVLAGLHWYLSHLSGRERVSPLTGVSSPIQFRDCFIYGKSINNVKIESWWNRLCKGRTQFWRVSSSS
jgi:arginine repressor